LLYLPAFSPDFSPIENAFAKLKALLRREAAGMVNTKLAKSDPWYDFLRPPGRKT